ncbi:MAG: phenylacetate--CoA ligase family protein [Acidimicrobiales bacterium]
MFPPLAERLDWSAEALSAAQDEALRHLVRVAIAGSSWHRERLSDIDVGSLHAADLGQLPVMSKDDLMDNFDDIVTDRRLTRELCERHVDALMGDDYLLDEYHVVASGGSSGRRGVFVYGWDAWATVYASINRFPARFAASQPRTGRAPVIASVAAAVPSHFSAAIGATFSDASLPRHAISVTERMESIVDQLNELQPTRLMGYSSFLPRLAREAREGRLRIRPDLVTAISEPLLPEDRAELELTWEAPVASAYGMSEGLFCGFCGYGSHLPDDLCLLEPIGLDGAPVAAGVTSTTVYVTNLFNTVLPLIRYEVTDEVTVLDGPCACGSSFRRIADPLGRLDDTFTYPDGTAVHPHVFRDVLGNQQLIEYQVQQTPSGADIVVVGRGDVDSANLAHRLEESLRHLGLRHPVVRVVPVNAIARQPSGKLKRFVPLS